MNENNDNVHELVAQQQAELVSLRCKVEIQSSSLAERKFLVHAHTCIPVNFCEKLYMYYRSIIKFTLILMQVILCITQVTL